MTYAALKCRGKPTMLRWRLLFGTLLIAALVALCWLDQRTTAVPGAWLMPVAIAAALLATKEVLDLAAAAGMRPLRWTVYLGNVLLVTGTWLAPRLALDAERPAARASVKPDGPRFGENSIAVLAGPAHSWSVSAKCASYGSQAETWPILPGHFCPGLPWADARICRANADRLGRRMRWRHG